jgi:signal transduction histidine kinase
MSSANRASTTSPAHSAATLVYLDISPQLDERPTRPPNYEHEARALSLLAREMAENPRNILQCFVEIVVYLCDAGAAGINLLDGDLFRWQAVAGSFAAARGGTMPRDQSPSRGCIDRNATQLMQLADRSVPGSLAESPFTEALLIPFCVRKEPVGTVWVVGDQRGRTFDREDERVVRVLAQIASAGWQLWKTSEADAASSRHKDDFIAMVGHELRNPFAAITTAAANLHRFVDGDAAAHRSIDVIVRQSHHVSRLLDDLLEIARINSGKLHLERRLIDVRSVVAETIDTRRAQIDRRRQMLVEDLGEASIRAEADPVRLAQIVSNLVENASKYTPEGGHISVTLVSRGSDVELAVEDDGVGIPPERCESIFEPFTQLSTRQTTEGLGLGLALVRNLTALHGGHVSVTSAGPGQGSRFVVRLPVDGLADAAARSRRREAGERPEDPRPTTPTM